MDGKGCWKQPVGGKIGLYRFGNRRAPSLPAPLSTQAPRPAATFGWYDGMTILPGGASVSLPSADAYAGMGL